MSKSPTTVKDGKKLPPIHPGRILLEDMKYQEISINGLAPAIRVPANRISLIVTEKPGITARLGRCFGDLRAVLAQHPKPFRSRLHRQGYDREIRLWSSGNVILEKAVRAEAPGNDNVDWGG